MNFEISHLVCRCSDIGASKVFYVNKLGLEILEEEDNFFAVRSGNVRISFFGGAKNIELPDEDVPGLSVIFKTDDIKRTKEFLDSKNIALLKDITEAPGFMKFMALEDPDRNIVYFGEYLGDILEKKV